MLNHQRAAGFTVVELLVVLAIIAILASIGFPVYRNMARNVRYNTCMQNMQDIGVALALYRNEYGVYPPAPVPTYLSEMADPYGKVDVANIPISNAQWYITGKSDGTHITLKSAAELETGMNVRLYDRKAKATEDCEIDGIAGNTLTVHRLVSVDGSTDLTQGYDLAESITGDLTLLPIKVTDTVSANTVELESVAGLKKKMRVTLRDKSGNVLDEPIIADITGLQVTFATTLYADSDKIYTLEWATDDYGMATLYYLYKSDIRDYMRDISKFHCPEMRHTETVDRDAALTELQSHTELNPDARSFDPLWAGYNTYDLTYNYDQYNEKIKNYDSTLGFTDNNGPTDTDKYFDLKRQLNNPFAPANTVVCWCYGHDGKRSPVMRDTPELAAANSTSADRKSQVSLVLAIDGTVRPMSPYQQRSLSSNDYYWVPPFLYSAKDVR